MGRSFDTHEELDRPDLNKCPDCGCFFAQDSCPLCGKVCPEEMRAGNRKPPKKVKQASVSDRVTFVQWYHSWWFIIAMLFVFPIVGLVLFATSPHKKSAKITFVVVCISIVVLLIVSPLIITLIYRSTIPDPVDTSLTRDEYVARCQQVDSEQLYRSPSEFEGDFVTVKLKIKQKTVGYYHDNYTTYYICEDESGRFEYIILDCSQDGTKNFLIGDTITVFGEVTENYLVHVNNVSVNTTSINAAYIVVE